MPLFWLSLAFLTGLALGEGLALPWWDWAGLAALCRGVSSLVYYPRLGLVQHSAGSPILAALYGVRQQARHTLQRLMPAPESALLTGILLGIPSDMPQTSIAAFQATGTAHIWAISG